MRKLAGCLTDWAQAKETLMRGLLLNVAAGFCTRLTGVCSCLYCTSGLYPSKSGSGEVSIPARPRGQFFFATDFTASTNAAALGFAEALSTLEVGTAERLVLASLKGCVGEALSVELVLSDNG